MDKEAVSSQPNSNLPTNSRTFASKGDSITNPVQSKVSVSKSGVQPGVRGSIFESSYSNYGMDIRESGQG